VLFGWFLGLFTPLVYIPIRRLWVRLRAARDERMPAINVNPLGFFTLNTWSPLRSLERKNVSLSLATEDWTQSWLSETALDSALASISDSGGPSCTLRSIEIDHRESQRGQRLVLGYARSEYRDLLGVSQVIGTDPEKQKSLMERLKSEDMSEMVSSAPRSVTAVNVTVLSEDRRLLILRRSAAVRTSQNEWTLGPNETMLGPVEQVGGIESPFQLAERCLSEELDVHPDEVSLLAISWVGYNVPGALCHWVAHSRIRLRSQEISKRIQGSHGGFEVDAIDWIEFEEKMLEDISLRAERHEPDSQNRLWNRTAGLAALDVRRWKSELLRN